MARAKRKSKQNQSPPYLSFCRGVHLVYYASKARSRDNIGEEHPNTLQGVDTHFIFANTLGVVDASPCQKPRHLSHLTALILTPKKTSPHRQQYVRVFRRCDDSKLWVYKKCLHKATGLHEFGIGLPRMQRSRKNGLLHKLKCRSCGNSLVLCKFSQII